MTSLLLIDQIVRPAIHYAYQTEGSMMDMRERGVAAATAYLERAGQRILAAGADSPPQLDIVGAEGDTLVGTLVRTSRQASTTAVVSGPEYDTATRALRTYVEGISRGDANTRIDVISLLIISEDRALLRHHRGVTAE